jgi:hypothetical protein
MKELKDGREWFDGDPVDFYEGRFTGPFAIDEANGASLSNGDLVTFLVTARVESPKFTYVKKTGNLKRSNAMKVQAVKPIAADKARFLYDSLGEEVDGVNSGVVELPAGVTEDHEDNEVIVEDTFFEEEDQMSLVDDPAWTDAPGFATTQIPLGTEAEYETL